MSDSPRVLVVDDQHLVCRAIQRHLMLVGCDVRIAQDGQQGLDECLAWRPAAVILDRRLPRLMGDDLARRILAELDPAPALFMITGDAVHTVEPIPGVVRVFSKPVEFDALFEAMRPYLGLDH